MALHPQAQAFLDGGWEAGMKSVAELTPEQARAQARMSIDLVGPGPDVQTDDFEIAAAAGPVLARRYEPEGALGTIAFLHGGGFVICDLDTHDATCRLLAVKSGCRVIAVDYRLAPEHRFPAAVEDCWDALRWVGEQYAGSPLIVAGDSAGGNLAAVCAIRARDRGGPELALQVLIYPTVDHEFNRPSHAERGSGSDAFLTTADMTWFIDHYVPDRADRDNPEVSPIRTPSLAGLPPAIVLTAEYDPLRDEGRAYAERLREEGVAVSYHHYDDMTHAFFTFGKLMARGDEAVAQVGGEIRAALTREP
jgi:acetyl esterase